MCALNRPNKFLQQGWTSSRGTLLVEVGIGPISPTLWVILKLLLENLRNHNGWFLSASSHWCRTALARKNTKHVKCVYQRIISWVTLKRLLRSLCPTFYVWAHTFVSVAAFVVCVEMNWCLEMFCWASSEQTGQEENEETHSALFSCQVIKNGRTIPVDDKCLSHEVPLIAELLRKAWIWKYLGSWRLLGTLLVLSCIQRIVCNYREENISVLDTAKGWDLLNHSQWQEPV